MDPDVTLDALRTGVTKARAALDEGDDSEAWQALLEMVVDAAAALDAWLTKGGFPPRAWSHPTFRRNAAVAELRNQMRRLANAASMAADADEETLRVIVDELESWAAR